MERLSYANLMATAAVFIALGGGAYAAALANNSVKSKHIADGQVKTPDLANGAVKPKNLAPTLRAQIAELKQTVAAQQALLNGVSRETVDGNKTLRFSGMNVQVVNGTGTTDGEPNKLGNLIVGYNGQPFTPVSRTGSHYLVIGDRHQWTRYGGILAGFQNTASGAWASVSGGIFNTAGGNTASVSGGFGNTASGNTASVSGGYENTASGSWSSVSGGVVNTASGARSSILGGSGKAVTASSACHPTC